MSSDQIRTLKRYTACDISDALLKLKVPGSGFIPDLQVVAEGSSPGTATIAPASTVLFAPKGVSEPADYPPTNIPEGKHWVDLTESGTFVVLKQPEGQKNAVCGGIMAVRMNVCKAQGIVVLGRARDVEELRSTGLPIWSRGLSTVGAGASSTPWAVQVSINIDETVISPGDLVFSDPVNGVVVIPQNKVDQVVELLPRITAADDRVKEDVLSGTTVKEAFKKHRSAL